jgi:hypothetical protein
MTVLLNTKQRRITRWKEAEKLGKFYTPNQKDRDPLAALYFFPRKC